MIHVIPNLQYVLEIQIQMQASILEAADNHHPWI
jgi:hypothetical protein